MLPTAQSDGSWTGEKSWQSSEKELGAYEQCDVLENIELQSFQWNPAEETRYWQHVCVFISLEATQSSNEIWRKYSTEWTVQ